MNANRYMRDSLQTADRSNMDRLKLECALGLCGEAGEVAEQVKKHFFHGHELDKRHMIEELGDVAWYLAVLCDAIGSDLDTVMEENLKKKPDLTNYNSFVSQKDRLLASFNENKDDVVAKVESAMKDVYLTGKWSVDIMLADGKMYLIDMATAETSYYYNRIIEK